MENQNQNHRNNRNESWKNQLRDVERPSNGDRRHYPNEEHENKKENKNIKMVKGKNTVDFKPRYDPPDLRLIPAPQHWKQYKRPYSDHDVVLVNGLFCLPEDLSIYNQLLDEIESSGIDSGRLWKMHHGNQEIEGTHVIADDKANWKRNCPTFSMVIDKMAQYFNMDVKATRFNWYRDSSEWKPFHHDAAAVKEDKARTQNLTLAVSFGMEREAAFEHAKTKTVVSVPQYNGTIYAFGRDVNVRWRHGIPAVHPKKFEDNGRISIIAWGWIDDMVEEK